MFSVSIQFRVKVSKSRKKAMKNANSQKSCRVSFMAYANKEIEHMWKKESYSTSKNYRTALHSFLRYRDGKDIMFKEFDSDLIDDYNRWLRHNNICPNTISCYMRSLRAIYNKAVKIHLARQTYPFSSVFTGIAKTDKRSVTIEDISHLQKLDLKKGSFKEFVRDLFLFSFFALGMPFIDLVFLRKSQIIGDNIVYYRHKTGQKVTVRLEPCMSEIICRYNVPDSEFVFPLITKMSTKDSQSIYNCYKSRICYYNKILNGLGKEAGIVSKLTSYVARHTWASLAYEKQVDLTVISKALGHTNTKTTQIYVKELNNDKLNKANKKIIAQLFPLYKSYARKGFYK